MSLTDATLDSVVLSTACPEAVITSVSRPLAGAIRDEHAEVAGRAGAWVFPEEQGDITITLGISVLVDTVAERRAAINKLRAWCQTPDGRAPLIISDESDRYWDAVLIEPPPMEDDETFGMTRIVFSARPNAYSTSESTEAASASGSPDSDTFTASTELPADVIVEITPTNGTITELTFTLNGDSVEWSGPSTIAQDETITISTPTETVTLAEAGSMLTTGVFDPNDVSMQTVALDDAFPQVVNGSNSWSLSWSGTATAVDVDFSWIARYE